MTIRQHPYGRLPPAGMLNGVRYSVQSSVEEFIHMANVKPEPSRSVLHRVLIQDGKTPLDRLPQIFFEIHYIGDEFADDPMPRRMLWSRR